jgi:glycosyltransferase involved in cell wall biosynthesis
MKKNKIAFVTDEFNVASGVTTYLLILFESIQKEFDILLITSQGTAIKLLSKYKIKYLLLDSINYKNRNIYKFTKSVIKLGLFFRNNDIKLVHSHDHYSSNIVAYSKLLKKITHIRTIHSWSDISGYLNKYAGDFYICVNFHVYKNVIEKNGLQKRAVVILNGIPFNNEFRLRKNNANSLTNLLVVSRLVFEKGIQNVLKAIEVLPDEYKCKVVLRIAGEGIYKSELIDYSISNKLNVEFLGEVIDVDKEYLNADITIFPSLEDWFGLVNIEATKFGCFVITSNFNGVEYIFEDNVDGFMYEKDSFSDLSEKIKKAIDIGEERNKYVLNFYKKCKEQYNSKLMVSKTQEIYNKYL